MLLLQGDDQSIALIDPLMTTGRHYYTPIITAFYIRGTDGGYSTVWVGIWVLVCVVNDT